MPEKVNCYYSHLATALIFFLMNTLYHMVPFTQKKKTKKKPQDSIIPPHPKKTHQNNMPVDQKSVIKATVWKNKQQI